MALGSDIVYSYTYKGRMVVNSYVTVQLKNTAEILNVVSAQTVEISDSVSEGVCLVSNLHPQVLYKIL